MILISSHAWAGTPIGRQLIRKSTMCKLKKHRVIFRHPPDINVAV